MDDRPGLQGQSHRYVPYCSVLLWDTTVQDIMFFCLLFICGPMHNCFCRSQKMPSTGIYCINLCILYACLISNCFVVITDTAAYLLQKALEVETVDAQPLIEAVYWLESAYLLETLNASSQRAAQHQYHATNGGAVLAPSSVSIGIVWRNDVIICYTRTVKVVYNAVLSTVDLRKAPP